MSIISVVLLVVNIVACTGQTAEKNKAALLERYRKAVEYIRQDTTIHQFAQRWGQYGEDGVMVADSIICLPTMLMKDKFIEWRYQVKQSENAERFGEILLAESRRWYSEQDTCRGYSFADLSLLNSQNNSSLTVYFSAPDGLFLMAEVIGTFTANGEKRTLQETYESRMYIFYFDENNNIQGIESALSMR